MELLWWAGCPTHEEAAGRLPDALARPWDLPHWVDPRKPEKRTV
jgi:hypothetical protein